MLLRLIKKLQSKRLVPGDDFGTFLPNNLATSAVLDSVWQKREPIFFVAYVRGLQTIHQLGLANVSNLLPSPEFFLEKLR
jgi:hypothetical protein